jgi:exodeoxyribonuclease V beta subunit
VLDYKSNRLPDYGPVALARAVREGEYDLQYVLYVLALHRWLRFRLGAAYVPERDLGGVRYVFCRGLDPADPARPGVFAPDVPVALVRALDDLMRAPDA